MPLPAIVHWEGNHWMVLFEVGEHSCAWPIRRRHATNSAKRVRAELVRIRRAVRLHDAFEKAPEGKRERWRGSCRFSRSSARILLQVLLLAVAVSFLQLLFPGVHRDGRGQGDRRKRHRPSQDNSARNGRGARFRSALDARAGIPARVSPRCDSTPRSSIS